MQRRFSALPFLALGALLLAQVPTAISQDAEKKKVTLTYEAAKNAAKDTPVPDPLILNIKNGALVAASWDATTLGVLGPPQLTPFGGKNPQVNSVAACQSLNTLDPRRDCVTWGSNR